MLRTVLLALSAFILTILLAFSALDAPSKISPQGCRMSYMSPSYMLQTGFNASWTSASLASRYRLMLYREVGWDSNGELHGVPALFIPGNAGSAHQVRSIASSASRQYYSSPGHISPDFASRDLKPLDVFAVDFNEDLSAFHGPTLESQRRYSADAVSYILSLYPPDTQVMIMGHSMGGLVATALLPASHINAIITMSTPHGVPPARFDSRMDAIYKDVQARLAHDSTPILSICGGVTDTMIPSEFCALPPTEDEASGLRKTVFTSSLEGCWSGVGHREMVWCHQVRWRVARAALELGGAGTEEDTARILGNWFRDGIGSSELELEHHTPVSSNPQDDPQVTSVENLPFIMQSSQGSRSYKLPISHDAGTRELVIFLSEGNIVSSSPATPLPLDITIHRCRRGLTVDSSGSPNISCDLMSPTTFRLIPNPELNRPFPVPHEGVDESDGVVVLTVGLEPPFSKSVEEWILLEVHSETTGGWVVATTEDAERIVNYANSIVPLIGSIDIHLDPNALHSSITFPNLLSSVLFVYRAQAKLTKFCEASLLPPLLLHTSGPAEAHYHRLSKGDTAFLHGHSSAPFLPNPRHISQVYSKGLNLTVYSSSECGVETLTVTIDWWKSFGRWGTRYWNAILAWSVGVVSFTFYSSWSAWDAGAPMPTPFQSFNSLLRIFPHAMVLFFLFSFLPLPSTFWLGNVGEPIFAFLAPFLLFVSCGLVILSWIIVAAILVPYGKLICLLSRPEEAELKEQGVSFRGGLLTILVMSLLVFLFIPWQVAFLACYLIHFHHCAALVGAPSGNQSVSNTRNQKLFLLLAMTWCLPVVAPVLAVWVRTLATAGLTTPFDGDHFVLNSLAFVALTYAMVTTRGSHFQRRHRWELIPVPYLYVLGAVVAFLIGPRSAFRVYEALNWPTFALFCFRVAPRFVKSVRDSAPASTSVAVVRKI